MQGEEEECVFLLMECLRATIEGVVVRLSIHVCMYLSICLFVCLYLFIPLMVLPFCLSVCLIVFYFAALPPPANTQNGLVFREAVFCVILRMFRCFERLEVQGIFFVW